MTQTAVIDAQALTNRVISQTAVPTFTANVWRSAWVDVKAFRRLTGGVALSHASASRGVVLEQSFSTGPDADTDAHVFSAFSTSSETNPATGQAYHSCPFSVERIGLYARLAVKKVDGDTLTGFVAAVIGGTIT